MFATKGLQNYSQRIDEKLCSPEEITASVVSKVSELYGKSFMPGKQ